MTERYECTLSPELLDKAVTELNEPRNNDERLNAIDQLRNSYDVAKYGPLVRDDDAFILRFLRAKKFKQEKALKVLQNYHSIKKELKDVFERVHNPVLLEAVVEKGVLSVFDGKCLDGSTAFMYRPGLLGKSSNLHDLMAYGVLAMEKLLEEEEIQICGVSTIEDLEDFNISIFFQVSPFQLGKLNSIFQDAMPVRIKAVYILNEGKVFDALMMLFRPFMKKKLLERLHPFGNKYLKLYDYISPSLLPPCYGGTGPDLDTLVRTWVERLTEDWPQDTPL